MTEYYSALTFGMQIKRRTSTEPPEQHYTSRKTILLLLSY